MALLLGDSMVHTSIAANHVEEQLANLLYAINSVALQTPTIHHS